MNNAVKSKSRTQKSENRFCSFFDRSDDGMMLMDCSGIIREWSSEFERITGLIKEMVIGKMHLWEAAESVFPFEKRTRVEV